MNLNYKIMRRLVFALLMLFTLSMSAQDNVMKFMGIPIDGTKSEMIDKLQQKGFAPEQIEIDLERAEENYIAVGGEIIEGRNREKDGGYYMHGYFNGARCKLVIMSYKSKVYKIVVAFEDSYKDKFNAFTAFNNYAERLQNKYYDENNFYKPLDYSGDLKLDADYFNMFFDKQKMGGVTLHITYPETNMEYHIILEYLNVNNMPNGEDL